MTNDSPNRVGRQCYGCVCKDDERHDLFCPNRKHCWAWGPKVAGEDDAPLCVLPIGHDSDHRADESWGDMTWPNTKPTPSSLQVETLKEVS